MPIVRICDAIMGSGKTQAAIQYINEHPEKKFIYITPYLDEAARIKAACPMLHFVEPNNRNPKYQFKKYTHACALVREGKNIATTHAAFKYYTDETLNDIRENEYTLIVDENINILEKSEFAEDDLKLLVKAGCANENSDVYTIGSEEYTNGCLSEIVRTLRSMEIVKVGRDGGAYYWSLPPKFFTSFKDVFVLTYLFSAQSIYCLLESNQIPYVYIGVEHKDGLYRFCDNPGNTPPYVSDIRNKIHIVDRIKMNEIGKNKCSISMNWFSRGGDGIDQLRRHIQNLMQNVWRDIPASQKLWGSYKIGFNKLKGKGYTKLFLPFNARATNDYRGCTHLIYAANVFMNVGEKRFYESRGVTVDEDTYALSVMVQWIWRSAIRDGGEITIYIPSKRMRSLLENWIDSVSRGAMQIKAAPDVG